MLKQRCVVIFGIGIPHEMVITFTCGIYIGGKGSVYKADIHFMFQAGMQWVKEVICYRAGVRIVLCNVRTRLLRPASTSRHFIR